MRHKKDDITTEPTIHGLTNLELDQLATYNAERSRGIVHSDTWQNKMLVYQQTFDAYRPHSSSEA